MRTPALLFGAVTFALALGACVPQAGSTSATPADMAATVPVDMSPTAAHEMATPAAPADAAAPATAQRIAFATGGSSASAMGSLEANGSAKYVLALEAGKTFIVTSTGNPNPVAVSVYGADGTVLQSPMGGLPGFEGQIPSTQDYNVDVIAGSGPTSYTVTFEAPAK